MTRSEKETSINIQDTQEVFKEALQLYLQSFNQYAIHHNNNKTSKRQYYAAYYVKKLFDKISKAKTKITLDHTDITNLMICTDAFFHQVGKHNHNLNDRQALIITKALHQTAKAYAKTAQGQDLKDVKQVLKEKNQRRKGK